MRGDSAESARIPDFWDCFEQYVQSRLAQFEFEWNSLAEARESRRKSPILDDVWYRIADENEEGNRQHDRDIDIYCSQSDIMA